MNCRYDDEMDDVEEEDHLEEVEELEVQLCYNSSATCVPLTTTACTVLQYTGLDRSCVR